MIKSLINDRVEWWMEEFKGNEKVAAIEGSNDFYRLIGNSSPRRPIISEAIEESDGPLIQFQDRWLEL